MKWLLASALLLLAQPAAAECKLALALGLDISSSVNADEYALQLEGLAHALETEEVIGAILAPEGAHIAAAVYEWSGYAQQDVIIGWTTLDSPAAVRAFTGRLRRHVRLHSDFATALGKGVEFGARLLQTAPDCRRRVLDVSGDGVNNIGVGPEYFREQGLYAGIVINGLVIQGASPDPATYYYENVISGPEAFIITARGFDEYRDAMTRKLLREVSAEMVVGDLR
ncbi:DUF1194 domain-containing protein [Rhodobacteraceae bacterium NNCM2]|nr:DUF1194 domain-containing protein [Coraliihabitans acroporae]